jgi:hypothetical protein
MKEEFYNKLAEVIKECEAHPYKSTKSIDLDNGREGRVSKQNLGTWTDEDYDTMFNHQDKRTEDMCNKSSLDCFVYCDRGGYMYLVFE